MICIDCLPRNLNLKQSSQRLITPQVKCSTVSFNHLCVNLKCRTLIKYFTHSNNNNSNAKIEDQAAEAPATQKNPLHIQNEG